MAVDLVIDIENTPGALAQVAAAISDAGVNIAAATCVGAGERAELHILVPHAEAARHSLAISHVAVNREREVVVVDVEDRPGVLADLTRKISRPAWPSPSSTSPRATAWSSGRPTSTRSARRSTRRDSPRAPRARRVGFPQPGRGTDPMAQAGHPRLVRSTTRISPDGERDSVALRLSGRARRAA